MRARTAGLLLLAASGACLSSPGLLDLSDVISLRPGAASVPPRGALTFSATGGTAQGYRFSLEVNRSGATVDEVTGAYVAGARGNVSDVVRVDDAAGHHATATIAVGPAIAISPAGIGMAPGSGPVRFLASGGSGTGWVWALVVNSSGGTIDPATGDYVAGPTPVLGDRLQVTDSLGNVATARIDVGDVLVSPSSVTLLAGATQKFSGAVTSEPVLDVAWDVVEGAAGGAIVATTPESFPYWGTCTYQAPSTPGTYHLRATSTGNPAKSGVAEILVVAAP